MSDFFAPSYWYGAGPNIAPLPINTNYGAQLNQQLAYVGGQNQAALAAAAPTPPGYGQVHLPFLSGSFGPAAAAGTYSPGSGRSSFSGVSLGGGGGGGGGYPSGNVQRGPDLPAPDTSGYDPLSQGTPQYDPWTGAITGYSGGGIGSDMLRGGQNGPANPYAQMYRMPAANPSYFNPGTYAGDKNNYGLPFNPAGVPKPPTNGPYPNLGYNPAMQNSFANPAMGGGAFQGRFGMGFPNAGTPSQYAPGAAMPPGFLSPYSVDNPQGALPLGWNNSFNN